MIYLDNAATTKPSEEAVLAAKKYLETDYFNPSSLYGVSIKLKSEIERCRRVIADKFPEGYEVIFTSCGSESDNTAVFSCAKKGKCITTAGEHSAVYESFCELKKRGNAVEFAPLDRNGGVNEEALLSMVDEKTTLVSVVHVNNETGAINDVNKLAEKVKSINPDAVFHSDGVQAFGKLPYTISGDVDLYSVSAHKIGGIKGVGAIVKRKNLRLTPLIFGGGQENGMRSGTENVFGISVFGYVAEEHFKDISAKYSAVKEKRDLFVNAVGSDGIRIISDENCSPYIVSLSAEGLRGEVIQHMLEEQGVIIGTGSACSSRQRHSRILKNCGYKSGVLDGALRVSLCDSTSEDEVIKAAEKIKECVAALKRIMQR